MKKLMIGLVLGLVLVGVFVGARGKIISLPANNGGIYDYEYTTQLQKGWNLIAFSENFPSSAYQLPSQVEGGVLPPVNKALREFYESYGDDEDAPLYAFAYDISSKSYKRIFPSPEFELASGDPSAIWVYAKESGEFVHFAPNVKPLSQIQLDNGWNFLGINPEMVGKELGEIAGGCNIENAYAWGVERQTWDLIALDGGQFSNDVVGLGMVVKVSSDCTLGSNGGSTTAPPTLPVGNEEGSTDSGQNCTDSDGGNYIYTKGTLAIIVDGQTATADESCVIDTDSSPTGMVWSDVSNCTGTACYVREGYCETFESSGDWWLETSCPNGCLNGACIQ